jgi:L-seryl-tRNA(Ser) seleniumtransferase
MRELVGQLNRSTVVSGARSYLEQLRAELQDRFSKRSWSSPSDLAERAARYILGPFQQQRRVVINATGELFGRRWATVPLSTAAQDALVVLSGGYTLPNSDTSRSATPCAIELICSRSGAEDAIVVHSYQGAIWLVLAALAGKREVLIARGEAGHTEGATLSELFAASGARPVEVGAANIAVAEDYESQISEQTAMVLRVRNDDYQVVGHTCWASCEELAALTRDRELIFTAALDRAALDSPHTSVPADDPAWNAATFSAAACVSAGADLVLLRGEGWLGGPPCGVILGRRDLVELIRQHPLFAAWRADNLRLAALAESLRPAPHSGDGYPEPNVIRKFANTPLDNLQHRAHRLADQLSNAEELESARAEPLPAGLFAVAGLSSYGVVLVPREGQLNTLVEQLATAQNPVMGRLENGSIVLDLRAVFPEQDQQIASVFGSLTAESPGQNAPSPTETTALAN